MASRSLGYVVSFQNKLVGIVLDARDPNQWVLDVGSSVPYYMRCPAGVHGWEIVFDGLKEAVFLLNSKRQEQKTKEQKYNERFTT